MGEVLSLRLSEEEERIIEKLAEEEKKDKSSVARELLRYGNLYRAIKLYRERKISLGRMADLLDLSIPECMDILSEFGIEANIDYDVYLESYENLKKVW